MINGTTLAQELAKRARAAGLEMHCGGHGNFNAELAIIAEYPDETECNNKIPLSGNTGKVLFDALRRIGVARTDAYCTNTIKRRVVSDNINTNEEAHYAELLRWELGCLPHLKYVLVLGNAALKALTGHTGIEKWRGSVTEVNGVWYCCTYNPAIVFHKPHLEVILALDIAKLAMVRRGEYISCGIVPHIDPSPSEVVRWVDRLQDQPETPVSVDIEFRGNYETDCIGLTNSVDEGMCINFLDHQHDRYSHDDERAIRLRLQRLFSDKRIKFVGQNANFDAYWLWYKDRLKIHGFWHDTLLAHHTLYPILPHNLGFLVAQYTTHPYYKDEIMLWKDGQDVSTRWIYNVKDVCLTLRISQALDRELKQRKLDEFFYTHIMRIQPHLTAATVHGVLVDTEMKARLHTEVSSDVERLLGQFYEAARRATDGEAPDYSPNPNSAPQMKKLFFDKMRVSGVGTKVDKTNMDHILQSIRTTDEQKAVVRALRAYRKERKFLSTYVEMEIDNDNRCRTEYKQYGTITAPGRLSSTGVMWGTGTNLQNQPPRARPMFIADDGYVFVYFDLSQAEARVVAYIADIPKWKAQFERARLTGDYDCHRALAAEMWHLDYESVPKKDVDEAGEFTKRYIAKRCRHGLNYRMAPDRLAEVTGLSNKEAEQAYILYHRTSPEVKRWWKWTEEEYKTKRVLYNAFGRPLPLLGRLDPYNENQLESIVAFYPQSTIGDKVAKVIAQSHEDDAWPSHSRILLNVHDALIALCREDKAMRALQVMKRHAEEPLFIRGDKLIIPADCKISVPDERGVHHWDEKMKPVTVET